MSTAISGRIALLRFNTSTPDMSESERSTRATSKGEARTCAIASSPVRASPATSMSTRPEKTCFRPIRTTSWSSTISSRIIVCCPTGLVHVGITALVPPAGIVGAGGFLCRTNPTLVPLKGIFEDNPVPLHGNVFPREAGKVGHQVSGRLVHDAAVGRVVAKRAIAVARGAALVLAQVMARKQVQLRLAADRHGERGGAARHARRQRRL